MKLSIVLLLAAIASGHLLAAIDQPSATKMAVAQVSRELEVPEYKIEIVSAEAAEWRDSSLGCALKAERYRPEVTRGFKVTLAFDGDRAVVHVGEQRAIICSHTRSTKVSSAPLAVAAAKMTRLARTDLATQLKVAEREIEVVAAKPTTWPNASLGCPVAGRTYVQTLVAGFTIQLTHRNKIYRYHSDLNTRVVSCEQSAASADSATPPVVVIHAFDSRSAGECTANPDVRLSISNDASLSDDRVLNVEYPAPSGNPALRDVRCAAARQDWSGGSAIAFQIKPEHSMRISVSFIDRNHVAYTAWRDLTGDVWQPVRIPFNEIRPNPYFQPPDARTGAALDVSDVKFIAFAPQDQTSGRLTIGRFVVVR